MRGKFCCWLAKREFLTILQAATKGSSLKAPVTLKIRMTKSIKPVAFVGIRTCNPSKVVLCYDSAPISTNTGSQAHQPGHVCNMASPEKRLALSVNLVLAPPVCSFSWAVDGSLPIIRFNGQFPGCHIPLLSVLYTTPKSSQQL